MGLLQEQCKLVWCSVLSLNKIVALGNRDVSTQKSIGGAARGEKMKILNFSKIHSLIIYLESPLLPLK